MRGKFAALAFSVATGFAWWSCSGDDDARGGGSPDGGGGASTGGAGGTSAAGGLPVGGGGLGASGSTDGGFGEDPQWELTTAVASGCPVERLANAAAVRLYNWSPCSWSPRDCEQAVLNPKLIGLGGGFVRTSVVHDDGKTTRVALLFEVNAQMTSNNFAAYALESGEMLDAFRGGIRGDACHLWGASLWGERYAVKIGTLSGETNSGIVGKLADGASPSAFNHPTQPPGGAQGYYLGSDRWVWWWAPKYSYTSVSTVDGSDYVQFADTGLPSSLVYVGEPTTAGKTFLFQAFDGDDAGIAHGKIMWSDGVAAPKVYLEPGSASDVYGSPIYAHSHVAYFIGKNAQDTNKFDSVELWASPYSEQPGQLQPVKLSTLPTQSIPPNRAGGWGFAAFPSFVPGTDDRELVIWNLANGTSKTHLLPEGYDLTTLLGVSRTHLFVGASDLGKSPSPYLIRIKRE